MTETSTAPPTANTRSSEGNQTEQIESTALKSESAPMINNINNIKSSNTNVGCNNGHFMSNLYDHGILLPYMNNDIILRQMQNHQMFLAHQTQLRERKLFGPSITKAAATAAATGAVANGTTSISPVIIQRQAVPVHANNKALEGMVYQYEQYKQCEYGFAMSYNQYQYNHNGQEVHVPNQNM